MEERQMSEKKVVNRTVAIALGLVCIVLLAGLVATVAMSTTNTSNTQTINDLQAQIASKNNTITSLNSQIASLQNQLNNINQNNNNNSTADLEAELEQLNAQLQYYNSVFLLNESEGMFDNLSIAQEPSTYTVIWQDNINYAGYAAVTIQATSNTTYVQTLYTYKGVNYNNNVTVGTSGTAYFPVLPGLLEIRLGNTELVDTNNATVTATYYY